MLPQLTSDLQYEIKPEQTRFSMHTYDRLVQTSRTVSARPWHTDLHDVETQLLNERGRRPKDHAQAKSFVDLFWNTNT